MLHIGWKDLGTWLVGVVAVVMLAILVSGIVIHRRIFLEFFTFRQRGSLHRTMLDLHNLSSVLLLPFHIVITFTGLIVFIPIYFIPSIFLIYQSDITTAQRDYYDFFARPAQHIPAALAAILLNALITGAHLLITLARGDWALAGTDLVLITVAGFALAAGFRLRKPGLSGSGQKSKLCQGRPA